MLLTGLRTRPAAGRHGALGMAYPLFRQWDPQLDPGWGLPRPPPPDLSSQKRWAEPTF